MSHPSGCLYVVATPIGNLEDLSARARRILGEVDLIAAEDTRHSARLLQHLGLHTRMVSLHQHNESAQTVELLERLQRGQSIALISDAGTPLLSDPGFELVRAARAAGLPVYAVPGPSALVAALSVAGLPADRFVFEGFLPHKPAARRRVLEGFARETRTVVCYESSHRIAEALDDVVAALGGERRLALARELTKIHEQVVAGTAAELRDWLAADADRSLGEFVLLIAGAPEQRHADQITVTVDDLLKALLGAMSVSEAARVAAGLSGLKKNALYERALQLQAQKS
ncbi:MAG TPA: 16S rRNA (cytidine(1402)-2'-O)-methyltransferase [Nevskiales bacterium]|nr:16S rRNA (cytidine(1402)-2'-O)-methyltransferase [Nevskiales bacterium]